MEAKNAPDAALDDLPMYWDPQYNFYQDMMPTPTGTPGQETVSEAPTVEAVFSPDTPAVTPIFVGRDTEGHRSRPSSGNRVHWMPGIPSPKHTKLTKHVRKLDVPVSHLCLHGAVARFTHRPGYPDAVDNPQQRKGRVGDNDLGRRRRRRQRELPSCRQTF
ncbi:hypothetical protein MRX96_057523 [Rhipicephalus microplus]